MERAELPRGRSPHANALSSCHPRACLPLPSIHPFCFFVSDVAAYSRRYYRESYLFYSYHKVHVKRMLLRSYNNMSFAINNLINLAILQN